MKAWAHYLGLAVLLVLIASCDHKGSGDTTYKYEYQTVENDPTNTLQYTLDNGLKVYMSVNNKEPRVQTYIAVRAGSKFDPSETTGLAHYLEHMVFKGTHEIGTKDWASEKVLLDEIAATYEAHRETADLDKKKVLYARIDSLSYEASKFAIANEYDKMISSLGAKSTNAYTSFDETVYLNDIPSNEIEKFLKVEGERFKTLVLRLFHTELETVYEEFNRAQDSDMRWVYQNVLLGLVPNHPYGYQTTIGEGEHLKNPSMYNIQKYFDTYYRPNNVAICLAGDLDPDLTIDLIKQYFGDWENKEVPVFEKPADNVISEPVVKETFGPQQERVYVGYKFDGAGSKEATMAQLVDMLLANSQAGLIDLNLNLKQKVLSAGSFPQVLHDYTFHMLYGIPKEGQTLEEVKDLLLGELDNIKQGNFDDWLLEAVVNDLKLNRMQAIESNTGRVRLALDAFINELSYEDVIFEYDKMSGITKEDIVAFANEYYKDNYVVSYKRIGESDRHSVPKPTITSLELDRDSKSPFYLSFDSISSDPVSPKFINFQEAITFAEVNDVELAYVKNEQNKLFNLYYIFDMGRDNSKELALAINYLPYLGTSKYSASELKQEFYKLALSFNVSASRDQVYVSLSGLEENLDAGVELFEHILSDVSANQEVYLELISDIIKGRNDAKLDKNTILRNGLINYTKYGANNPATDILSQDALMNIDIESLVAQIGNLLDYEHRIFYYGDKSVKEAKEVLAKHHQKGEQNSYPGATSYLEIDYDETNVFYVPYDMQQVELVMLARDQEFNPELIAVSNLFNEYFGSGLSSIVYQEIREQKALAYAAYAYFSTPRKAEDSHYAVAYIGTQTDKLETAITEMIAIMKKMPKAELQFNSAKEAVIKKMQTDWTTGEGVYWRYESAKKLGLDYDVREEVYAKIQEMTFDDLSNFFENHIANKDYNICVIGNENQIDKEVLQGLGSYKELTLEEIFGY